MEFKQKENDLYSQTNQRKIQDEQKSFCNIVETGEVGVILSKHIAKVVPF
jgi:hypothetical protein